MRLFGCQGLGDLITETNVAARNQVCFVFQVRKLVEMDDSIGSDQGSHARETPDRLLDRSVTGSSPVIFYKISQGVKLLDDCASISTPNGSRRSAERTGTFVDLTVARNKYNARRQRLHRTRATLVNLQSVRDRGQSVTE